MSKVFRENIFKTKRFFIHRGLLVLLFIPFATVLSTVEAKGAFSFIKILEIKKKSKSDCTRALLDYKIESKSNSFIGKTLNSFFTKNKKSFSQVQDRAYRTAISQLAESLLLLESLSVDLERLSPYLKKALKDKETILELFKPIKVTEVDIPYKKDNGEKHIAKGWRVFHNNRLGIGKGGIRFEPHTNEKEITAMAMAMTWKTALVGLKLGGAKGGVAIAPQQHSPAELEQIARGYVREILKKDSEALGPSIDVPAPDIGVNNHIMEIMQDEYIRILVEKQKISNLKFQIELEKILKKNPYKKRSQKTTSVSARSLPMLENYIRLLEKNPTVVGSELGFITGKPVEKGGIPGRTEATGYGVYLTTKKLREFAPKRFEVKNSLNKNLEGMTFAIQGFGNVASYAAYYIQKRGKGKITRITEYLGPVSKEDLAGLKVSKNKKSNSSKAAFIMLENPKGIDVEALFNFLQEGHSIKDYEQDSLQKTITFSEKEAKEFFISSSVDVLIPAAKENQISKSNVHLVKAKAIVEGANSPITFSAQKVLARRRNKKLYRTIVVPDIIANAGGVITSYLELYQNTEKPLREAFTHKQSKIRLEVFVDRAYEQLFAYHKIYRKKHKKITLKQSAQVLSLQMILEKIAKQKNL